MKRLRNTIPATVLVLVYALPASAQMAAPNGTGIPPDGGDTEPTAPPRRIQILVEQPGYRYTVPQIRDMVQESDVAWLKWVREQLAEDPGMAGRPPPP